MTGFSSSLSLAEPGQLGKPETAGYPSETQTLLVYSCYRQGSMIFLGLPYPYHVK